jgi:hypothetical protein
MKHSPHLNIHFSDNKCFLVDKNSQKMVAMDVEEKGLFQFDRS